MAKKRRRRIWEDEEKRRIVAQTRMPGVSVSQVARRYDVNANMVFKWLRDPRFKPPEDDLPSFLADHHLGQQDRKLFSRRLHTQRRGLLSSIYVGLWHKPDLRLAASERPLTSGFRTFGAECLVSGGKPTVF